jgi:hypothetical protein
MSNLPSVVRYRPNVPFINSPCFPILLPETKVETLKFPFACRGPAFWRIFFRSSFASDPTAVPFITASQAANRSAWTLISSCTPLADERPDSISGGGGLDVPSTIVPGDSTSTTESPGDDAQAMWCLVMFPNNNTGTDNPSVKPNLACERNPQSLSSVRVRKAWRIA